jgi:hypothetical protein
MYEFGSMLKLAEVNFNLPTLGARDLKANDMMNSFDFNQAPQKPLILPTTFLGGEGSGESTSINTQEPSATRILLPSPAPDYTPIAIAIVAAAIIVGLALMRRRGPPSKPT